MQIFVYESALNSHKMFFAKVFYYIKNVIDKSLLDLKSVTTFEKYLKKKISNNLETFLVYIFQ